MTISALLLALIKALPSLIALISSVWNYARSAKDRGIGADQAVKAGLEIAAKGVDLAREAEREAAAAHAAHPNDDGGFDPAFQRKD